MKIFARYARFQSHCFSITKSVSNVFTFIAQSYVDHLCGNADECDFGRSTAFRRQIGGILFVFLFFCESHVKWNLKALLDDSASHSPLANARLGNCRCLGAESACHFCHRNKRYLKQHFCTRHYSHLISYDHYISRELLLGPSSSSLIYQGY